MRPGWQSLKRAPLSTMSDAVSRSIRRRSSKNCAGDGWARRTSTLPNQNRCRPIIHFGARLTASSRRTWPAAIERKRKDRSESFSITCGVSNKVRHCAIVSFETHDSSARLELRTGAQASSLERGARIERASETLALLSSQSRTLPPPGFARAENRVNDGHVLNRFLERHDRLLVPGLANAA